MSRQEQYSLKSFLGDMWGYTKGFHRRIIFGVGIAILSTTISLVPTLLEAKIVNQIVGGQPDLKQLLTLVILINILILIRVNLRNRAKYFIFRIGEKIRLKTRQEGIRKLIAFDLKWHENQPSGKKVFVISRGADAVKGMVRFMVSGGGGVEIFTNTVIVLIFILSQSPKYFLISLANALIYIYVLNRFNAVWTKKQHHLNKESEKVVGKNFEYFSNINLIKGLGIGNQINNFLFHKEQIFTDKSIKIAKLNFDKWLTINNICRLFTFLTMTLLIIEIYQKTLPLGSFVIVMNYLSRLQDGLGSIADTVEEVIGRKLEVFRLMQLFKSGTTTTQIGKAIFPSEFKKLKFNQISFGYKSNQVILKDINFVVDSGEKVGIVGESGSGKSTITKLLLKLYLLNRGSITVDNLDLKKISPESIRQHIAIAPQDSEIFNLTFKENIAIVSGTRKFVEETYQKAIEISESRAILDKIKNNHNVLLGEKGIKLSGGERQRLGMARAIYKDSPIMIFDESTSSLDSATEEKILKNMEKLKDKTILWIAHRLSTLRFTDRIIVFDKGKIVEIGTFNELIEKQGVFYNLWQIQKKTKMG